MNKNIAGKFALIVCLGCGSLPAAIGDDDDDNGVLRAAVAGIQEDVSNLHSRVSTLENSTDDTPDFSGYGVQFSPEGSPKNVTVMTQTDEFGGVNYYVRSRYATSTETVSVNGVATQYPFLANYGYVYAGEDGTVFYVSNYIEATSDGADSYDEYVIEQSEIDPTTGVKTVFEDSLQEKYTCGGSDTSVEVCIVTVSKSLDNAYERSFSYGSTRAVLGPYSVNGISFEDIRIEERPSQGSFRLRAKGIGEIYRNTDGTERNVIYYRADGVEGGSLAGTPFDAGRSLDGLFF